MKKVFIFIGIIGFMLASLHYEVKAQIVDGAYKREDFSKRKPFPLPSVREADVMWSKRIWRIIDLREKMNQPLYFPTKETDGRRSFIDLLLRGIEDGQLTAYDARTDDEFKVPMTFDQVKEMFGATTRTRTVRDPRTGEKVERVIQEEIRSQEIKQIMVKEEWYFDKQTSTLNVRIIGVCPIQEFYRDEDVNQTDVQRRQVFWIYYPEARPLLASNVMFNPENDARDMSFDDFFIRRRFSSYIVKESNTFNNRDISSYLSGKDAMLESRQIENEIFNFEQDLWEY